MKSFAFAVMASAMVLGATSAWADAVVSPVNGSVLVSQGKGFVRQAQPTNLKIGDRVMVAQGSRAKITYGDGCSVDLLPGAVQIVKDSSPCAYKAQLGDRRDPTDNRDLGGYAVAGGVIALGTTAAVISLSEKDAPFNPAPTSP